eukprot:Em0018g169a
MGVQHAALNLSITSPLNPLTLLEVGVSADAAAQSTEEASYGASSTEASHGAWGTEASYGASSTEASHGAWGTEASYGAWGTEASHGALGTEASYGAWGTEASHGAWGQRHQPKLLIVKGDPKLFPDVERKLKRLFEYYGSGVIWMFLCSEGKYAPESQDACFEFQIYNGQLLSHTAKDPSYHLCYANKRRPNGRFGNKLWNKLPSEMLGARMELKEVLDFFGSKHSKRYGLFNPSIESTQIEAIPKELKDVFHVQKHRLEMYDIKSSLCGQRVDVRTIFDDGKLMIVRIIKDERRIASLDFIPTRRQHAYRMSISKQEIVHEEDPSYKTAEMMLEKIKVTIGSDQLILTPCTDEWIIDIIRHKIKDTYILNELYVVAISSVSEYNVKGWSCNEGEEKLLEKYGDEHWELELSNAVWECAFGKAVGLSPEESLALHMEPSSVSDAVRTVVPDCCASKDLITPEALEEFLKP